MKFSIKPALGWVKNNPIGIGSGILVIASIGCLVFVDQIGRSFLQDVNTRVGEVPKIQRLMKTAVKIPADQADKPAEDVTIPVNPAAVTALKAFYKDMGEEYNSVWLQAISLNRGDATRPFQMMVDGIFPDPGAAGIKLYDARNKYLRAFDEMMGKYFDNKTINPRLDAGVPVTKDELSNAARIATDNFLLASITPKRVSQLTPDDLAQLTPMVNNAKLATLKQRASSCHIYAVKTRIEKGYPFQLDEWATEPTGRMPMLGEVWEGQMGLWMQQEVVEALGRCNSVSDPSVNEIVAPVKQLVNIRYPRYTYAGIGSLVVYYGTPGVNGGPGMPGGPAPGPAMAGVAPPPLPGPTSDNFNVSPTGRRSNSLYDVRLMTVTVIVDFQEIPKLFDALAQTNFITVLRTDLLDVDEYESLRAGYYYGSGDAVQLTMDLETIWFRQWTSKLMPKDVRDQLSVPSEDTKAPAAPAAPGP